VLAELSSAPNSLLTGKITGNFGNLGLKPAFSSESAAAIQWVAVKFPMPINREINLDIREWRSIIKEQTVGSAPRGSAYIFPLERS
jgi:hypothetical protein